MKKPPFARVAQNLFMGRKPPPDHKIGLVFDVVVLCAYEYQRRTGEYGRAHVIHVPLDDMDGKPPTPHETVTAIEAGRAVASWLRKGKRVLVTCRQGRNRSGWVAGIALITLGVPAREAIRAIRAARGQDALDNPYFVKALLAYDPQKNAA
jgi:protein-tyrosine phosphatase